MDKSNPMNVSRRAYHNIALIGFMGCGKSSVGRLVAAQLGFQFVDTDDLIESRAGKSIADIFTQEGEAAFRQWESQIVGELADARKTVISTGGGLGAHEPNLAKLKEHALTICLWAAPEILWRRVSHQTHRPLLQDPDPLTRIRTLLAQREAVYKMADVLLDSGLRSIREVAQQVILQFHQARHAQDPP